LSSKIENKFLDLIPKIIAKDTSIYNSKVNFFTEEDGEKSDSSEENQSKPVQLSDYIRNKLLADGNDSSDSDEPPKIISLEEEQKQLKKQFWDSVNEMEKDDNGELLKERKISKSEKENEEKEFNEWNKKQEQKHHKKSVKSEAQKFWISADDENEKFLKK